MKTGFFLKIAILTSLILAATFSVASATSPVVLNGYQVDFVGVEMNGNTGTFTYAVTADPSLHPISQGLSHWTIGVGNCPLGNVTIIAGGYDTPTNLPVCSDGTYSCLAAHYPQVELGADPTTGVTGLKFGDANNQQLSSNNPGTHIFQVQVKQVVGTQMVQVGVKTKQGAAGAITGPMCNTPSAVTLSSAGAQGSDSTNNAVYLFIGLLITLTSLVVLRRVRS